MPATIAMRSQDDQARDKESDQPLLDLEQGQTEPQDIACYDEASLK